MKSKSLFYEPMTAFTDLILFFLAVYFALDFHTLYLDQQMNTHWHWTFAFWMIGIGALLGAISHGIGPHFSPMVKKDNLENDCSIHWNLMLFRSFSLVLSCISKFNGSVVKMDSIDFIGDLLCNYHKR